MAVDEVPSRTSTQAADDVNNAVSSKTQEFVGGKCHDCQWLANAEDFKNHAMGAFDAFVFDVDGVLFLGEDPIPNAGAALKWLVESGKDVFLFTNNSTVTYETLRQKMAKGGGPPLPRENIYCTSSLVALYLKEINFKGKVYLIGNIPMLTALSELDGVEVVMDDGPPEGTQTPSTFGRAEIDSNIGGVVMGFDPKINYHKIAVAHRIISQNPNAFFISTNKDRQVPTDGFPTPGTGSFVSALEFCTGKESTLLGKPSPFVLEHILKHHPHLRKDRICMVGDNLATDIAFGCVNGISSLLVETGVHKFSDARSANPLERPTFVIPSVASFVSSC